MRHHVETQWMGKMQFNSLVNGHTVVMDAPERVGGENRGPIPKPFVLIALSGCTGMDVISILRKAGVEIIDFDMIVSGAISNASPIEYTDIHLVYNFQGPQNSLQSALDAVMHSQEKLCGVSSMLKKIIPVTWEVNYNGVLVFTNQHQSVIMA